MARRGWARQGKAGHGKARRGFINRRHEMIATLHAIQRWDERFPRYDLEEVLERTIKANSRIRKRILKNGVNGYKYKHRRDIEYYVCKETWAVFVTCGNRILTVLKLYRGISDI